MSFFLRSQSTAGTAKIKMALSETSTWMLVTALVLLCSTAAAWSPCDRKRCEGPECLKQPADCPYGVTVVCGQMVCKKGLNEPCGGIDNWRGKCADTLWCGKDGTCHGCLPGDRCSQHDIKETTERERHGRLYWGLR